MIINNSNICKHPTKGIDNNLDCSPKELILNGGFENLGIDGNTFANWQEDDNSNMEITQETFPHEDFYSATFKNGQGSNDAIIKIRQNVSVNPGCYLTLSFAENLANKVIGELSFIASVYYTNDNSNPVNLINVSKRYPENNEGRPGFEFHQKTSDVPVPQNVNSVTVEFNIIIEGASTVSRTTWRLDSVSLRQGYKR